MLVWIKNVSWGFESNTSSFNSFCLASSLLVFLYYYVTWNEILWYCQISLLRWIGGTFCFAFTLFFVLTYHMLKWAVWVPQRRENVDSESEITSWSFLVLLCIVLLYRDLILIFQILIQWFRMIKWGWCRRCFLLKELIHFCRHSLEPGYQQW